MPWNQPTSSSVRSKSSPQPRWPPPPTVEDEVVALAKELISGDAPGSKESGDDEVVAHGAVDQQPIILEVAAPATQNQTHDVASGRSSVRTKSPSESFGPGTPVSTLDSNHDRRYIYIPQEGTEIPISCDDSYESERSSSLPRKKYAQGGKDITPLKTNVDDTRGRPPAASLRRDPSPYSYTPSSGKGQYSGDYFLSPDVMYSPAWNQNGHKVKDTVRPERGHSTEPRSHEYYRSHQGKRSSSGPAPARPSIIRQQSAMADPGSRVRAGQLKHAADFELSSDESDFEAYNEKRSACVNPAKTLRPSAHRASNSYHEGQTSLPVKDQNQSPKRRTWSPPRKSSPAYDTRTPLTTVSSPSRLTPQTALDLDAYFASNLLKQRNKPHKSSPLTSPFSSPPRSPRTEAVKASSDAPPHGLRSRPTSRPASPLSVHPPPQHPSSRLDSNRSTQPDPKKDGYGSRRSSPLPSPEVREYIARPGPRIEVQAAPPVSGGRSYSYGGDEHSRSTSHQPSRTHFSTLQSASRPRSRETYQRSTSYVEPTQHISPVARSSNSSPSLPPRSRPTTPRSSVDVASARPSLPACPRPDFVSGYNDWYMLGGRPNFDVCSPCMENVVGAEYKAWFARAPPKPPGLKTKCDFSSPWVRIAWLKTLKEKRQKPDILYAIASIAEEPCPGKMGAIRTWYSLPDPDTGKPVSNFDICPYCVRAIECIFPSLRGVFRYDHRQTPMKQRACDLRCYSRRFAGYIDRLESIANKADIERRSPRMHRFADYAREMGMTRECSKDDMVLDQAWHIMPQIPQFTVCEECCDEAVWPAIDAGSPLAAKFNRSMQIMGPGGVSCQLYSPRMRHVFRDAVRNNDLAYLQQHAIQRYNVERSLQARHAQARAYGDSEEIARIVQEWKKWE